MASGEAAGLTPAAPIVGVVMGSANDFGHMSAACEVLEELRIPYEKRVVSAHRTPRLMFEYGTESVARGLKVIIAGAGGAAHLPGMLAANTILPVIGVPIPATALDGLDSMLSIVQMPRGTPVATMAIGRAGAANAALLAARILASSDQDLAKRLDDWQQSRSED
ncbi:MAG TPA: 5-(carboxyamino)imidazole ribonucleotide mutase [Candidatus Binataceae bacterium]|nr:5-(carboxyamino)imidazole ribonucleotide mutase [Candidatus Binataceae bacterium]